MITLIIPEPIACAIQKNARQPLSWTTEHPAADPGRGVLDVDGYHCFVVQATPKRRDKCLFEGTIWIDAKDCAIVKIAGQPAKIPSLWIKWTDFIRRYQKIGECWLPWKDETVSQVRLFGRNTLTIDHNHYHVSLREGDVQTTLGRFSLGLDFHHVYGL